MKKREAAITSIGGGLKCDNLGCDFTDMSIPSSKYKEYINCPCPKCGANLLTKADYRTSKIINGLVKVINFICYFIPKKKLGTDMATMKIGFNGTGIPQVGPIKPIKKENLENERNYRGGVHTVSPSQKPAPKGPGRQY